MPDVLLASSAVWASFSCPLERGRRREREEEGAEQVVRRGLGRLAELGMGPRMAGAALPEAVRGRS